MSVLEELEKTFLEEYEAALLLMNASKNKAATILLSKALFALVDYLIVQKYNKLPKNHTERFRILEAKEAKLYSVVDTVWSKYTDTYSKPSSEETLLFLKNAIEEVVKKNEGISQKIKTGLGKK